MGSLQENKAKIYEFLNRFLPTDSSWVCELGSGKGDNLDWLRDNYPNMILCGVEIFDPYIKESSDRGHKIYKDNILDFVWRQNFNDIEYRPHTYLLLDVLEHIEKQDALDLINDMKASSQQILIFSPHGVCPQDTYDNNIYQKHLSSWQEEELQDLGFNTWVVKNFHEGLLEGASTDVVFAQWSKQ